jgi:hypothetical protein
MAKRAAHSSCDSQNSIGIQQLANQITRHKIQWNRDQHRHPELEQRVPWPSIE